MASLLWGAVHSCTPARNSVAQCDEGATAQALYMVCLCMLRILQGTTSASGCLSWHSCQLTTSMRRGKHQALCCQLQGWPSGRHTHNELCLVRHLVIRLTATTHTITASHARQRLRSNNGQYNIPSHVAGCQPASNRAGWGSLLPLGQCMSCCKLSFQRRVCSS